MKRCTSKLATASSTLMVSNKQITQTYSLCLSCICVCVCVDSLSHISLHANYTSNTQIGSSQYWN